MSNLSANQKLICALTVGLLGYVAIKKIKKRSERRWWVKPWIERRNEGRGVLSMVHDELREEDVESYKNFVRMNEGSFVKLLNLIKDKIEKQDTHLRQCISAEKRLSVTLRFLATGETFKSLSYYTRIGQSTLSTIVHEVLRAILECMREKYLQTPHTQKEWEKIAEEFQNQWNFPNCLGALDGKHINFRPPRSAGSFYRNYKGHDSIVLLALVGANYKFLYTNIGVNGRISDGGVFSRSQLASALMENKLNFPPHRCLPGRVLKMPFVIVADDAFPLKERIMKPYRCRGLSNEQEVFNYRLSRARRIVENAFGILVNRFKVLLNPINLSVEKVELITTVCCILHNFLIEEEGKVHCTKRNDTDYICTLPAMVQQGGNRVSKSALAIRLEFQEYFNTNGAVHWQQNRVNTHML